jgi:hypothetical protein
LLDNKKTSGFLSSNLVFPEEKKRDKNKNIKLEKKRGDIKRKLVEEEGERENY